MRGRAGRTAIIGGLAAGGWRESVAARLKPSLKSGAAERHLIAARKFSIATEAEACECCRRDPATAIDRSLTIERAASNRGALPTLAAATDPLLATGPAASGRLARAGHPAAKASRLA